MRKATAEQRDDRRPAQQPAVIVNTAGLQEVLEQATAEVNAAAAAEPAELAASAPKTSPVSELAARTVEQACNAAAEQVLQMGEQIMALAESVRADARALADDLRSRGKLHAERLAAFTEMTERARAAIRAEREHVAEFEQQQGSGNG